MTEDRVLELIEAYGADPIRWPENERAAAQSLLATTDDPRLRVALAEAQSLDDMLALATVPEISRETHDRLRLDAAAPSSLVAWLQRLLDWPGPVWQPTGALAAALILGVWVGAANPDTSATIAGLGDSPSLIETNTESDEDFDSFIGMGDSL